MERLKNVFSSSSSATAKLSKAFKFNSDHNILRRTNTNGLGGGNPFLDGPILEEFLSEDGWKAHIILSDGLRWE
ncbi:hypothetical protein L486_08005 [Kwoniella mangroviensis CBS 10435]|uniref:Uncharacterized protein n=1 Tax=Kwoniella mangroviensis CBS 10435 TaxID=1331196 RepID=A0A1B9IG78_9TREE|nr:hypothetical protein L486_08005 [Kwoniella mangroviensis CBS 10435]